MARRKRGTSSHTKYRRARERLATLEAQYAKVERSRPRTSGKKSAKTRTRNALRRKLGAARSQLTKARNAIARGARAKTAAKVVAKQKRGESAKLGWKKRRAPKHVVPSGDIWQHLMPDGTTVTVVLDKRDSSLEGTFWQARGVALEGKRDLSYFASRSVFDLDRQRRFPFVTDLDVIAEHADEIDFGPGFYKRRNEAPRNAA